MVEAAAPLPQTVREFFEDSYLFKTEGNKVLSVAEGPEAKVEG